MRSIIRALPALLSVGALAVTGLTVSGQAGSGTAVAADPAVPIGRPTKLMPIGDSITAGFDTAQGGYRTDLYQLLKADNRPVDFVGSVSSGSAALADKDNEGHGGWTIQGIHDSVAGWLNTYQPDVITLQIGTNDMYNDAAGGAAPGRLSALLDRIAATRPTAKTFVTSIPPINSEPEARRVSAFNATIPGIVAAKVAAGKQVTFVDTYPAFISPHEMMDNVHPEYGALSKAAAIWYGALTGVPLTRYEGEAAAHTTSNRVQRDLGFPSASGDGKLRFIDFDDSWIVFSFQTGAAGNYRVRVRAANGMGTVCSHNVSANGATPVPVRYASYGWDFLTVAAVDVPLRAGANTLRFTKGECYSELDAIDISPVPTA